ncbi:MAG: hypothetical protein E7Z67_01590 [Thermoplasmata archaeon]|nr:hypothetical protein [Thermoplasmata archaeon]
MATGSKMAEIGLAVAIALVCVAAVSYAICDEGPVDLEISVDGAGTTYPAPGTYSVEKGKDITIDIQSSEGWLLSKVTVDGSETYFGKPDVSISVAMDSGKSIVAHFIPLDVSVPESKEFAYDGVTHVAYEDNQFYTVKGGSATDAGNHEAILSLRYPEFSRWSDMSAEDKIVSWSIAPMVISASDFKHIDDVVYTGQSIRPTLVPMGLLTTDDFICNYGENIHAGIGTVDVFAKGNFTGNLTLEFNIHKKDLVLSTFAVDGNEIRYGDEVPEYKHVFSGFVTGEGESDLSGAVELFCDYGAGSDVGEYIIRASGVYSDDYAIINDHGSIIVKALHLSADYFEPIPTMEYLDERVMPTVTLSAIGESYGLNIDRDCIITYGSNDSVGMGSVFISGKGNATTEKNGVDEPVELVFNIIPYDVPDTWDGTVDTSWYNDVDTEFTLVSAEQLAGLATIVDGGDSFAGKIVKLDTSIDLYKVGEGGERISFDPIGDKVTFEGTFDGQGHTIENLYISGWDLGYEWGSYGSIGLFGNIDGATIENVIIKGAEVLIEGGDVGGICGSATGVCSFENISIEDSIFATYNNGLGGIIGWSGSGDYTFSNISIAKGVVLAGLWGSYDSSIGGIVGQAESGATYDFKDVDVHCRIDAYNDVTASYDYYNYRMCGMLIGRCTETVTIDGSNYPDMSKYNVSCNNVTVTYEDWANYHYCRADGARGIRVEAGYAYDGISAEYDHSVCTMHHMELIPFDQIFGGAQYGVKGLKTYEGVTVIYNN